MIEAYKAQKDAIEHGMGPMLVLAGPGSGKTTVITHRTKHLIEQCGIKPECILVITFTKAAALEMQTRFMDLMGKERLGVNFGTFHAIFFKILKYAYRYNAQNILRDEERIRILRDIIDRLDLEIEDRKEFTESVGNELSLVKGERLNPEHYYSFHCSEQNFRFIYQEYEKQLREANRIDFDDMMLLCYELLAARQDILSFWQQRYEYILVDEFQDINKLQYDIVRLLALPQNNLFIVGDDDQSIYRFRGAKPEFMLNFHQDYPDGKRVLLDRNYRSQENIVEAALRVIKNNKKRFAKIIHTENPKGTPVEICIFENQPEENRRIVHLLLEAHEKGKAYSEIAVLFRTNRQPRALAEKLMEYNIPFKMKDAVPNLYEHWIAKNILAYLEIASGSRERELFLSISNRPNRYLARASFEQPVVDFGKLRNFYRDKEYMVERIDKLCYDLQIMQKLTPFAAIQYLRKAVDYDGFLKEYAGLRKMKPDELFEVLDELQDSSKQYGTLEAWKSHIEDYKQEMLLQNEQRNSMETDGVALMTFHGSKGLEYAEVFIIDSNEEVTPHRKAVMEEDLEEERRMFYVAMTRAKEQLHIYAVKERYGKELSCSRFLCESELDVDDLKEQARIIHSIYGTGTILKNSDEKITIQFDKIKIPKVFSINMCIRMRNLRITK